MTSSATRVLSLRDPDGTLCDIDRRLVRFLRADRPPVDESVVIRRLVDEGVFIGANRLSAGDAIELKRRALSAGLLADGEFPAAVEHPRLPFVSYPYEWPAEMLHASAALTVRIARDLLSEGLGLKDATPYNVMFVGPRPCFIDWLSVETRDARDPIWLPLGQFCRTFVNPLILSRVLPIPAAQFLWQRRDGISTAEAYSLAPWTARLRYFGSLTLPALLERSAGETSPRPEVDPERARFTLEWMLGGLARRVRRLSPSPKRASSWLDYAGGGRSYTDEQTKFKETWLRETLAKLGSRRALDVGCNSGRYSEIAARSGASVVAIDSDEPVIGRLWREASREQLDILPLVVDIARPTPAIGWRNEEGRSFLDRGRGHFDLAMLLAVIHHLRWSAGIALPAILDLAAELTTRHLIIEFVDAEDPLYRFLAAGRRDESWNRDTFEAECRRRFRITHRQEIPTSHRALYLLEK